MASDGITYVDEITAKKDFVNMKVRIIRCWKQSYRLDMILLDERGNQIQATVKKELIPTFDKLIKEDSQVLIKKFGAGVHNDTYPVVENPLKMNFYTCTEVVPAMSFNGDPYGFKFVPFNEITKQKSQSVLNVDVIGSVTWCGNLDIFKNSTGKESKRFNLEMKDLEGRVVKCTLWGDYAVQFNNFVVNNKSNEHVITIMQHALIKEWKGEITIQSDMFGTRIFINEDIKEANDMRRRLILKEGGESTSQSNLSSQTVYPNRLEFLLNTERKKVDEIRETNKVMECVVLGTIMLLEEEYGWFYAACRKCNKKVISKAEYLQKAKKDDITEELLKAEPDTLWCTKEKIQATQLIPRYRVTFRVQDSTGSVSFLMFDRDVAKLVGVSTNDIRERQLKTNSTETFPQELNLLLNKLLAFKIVISDFNLEHKYGVYTIQKFCDDPSVIADLVAADTVNECTQEPQVGEISTAKLSESSQGGFDSKDAFSVTGDSLVPEVEKDTETSPLQKRKNDTPGVESGNKVSKRVRKTAMKFDV